MLFRLVSLRVTAIDNGHGSKDPYPFWKLIGDFLRTHRRKP